MSIRKTFSFSVLTLLLLKLIEDVASGSGTEPLKLYAPATARVTFSALSVTFSYVPSQIVSLYLHVRPFPAFNQLLGRWPSLSFLYRLQSILIPGHRLSVSVCTSLQVLEHPRPGWQQLEADRPLLLPGGRSGQSQACSFAWNERTDNWRECELVGFDWSERTDGQEFGLFVAQCSSSCQRSHELRVLHMVFYLWCDYAYQEE